MGLIYDSVSVMEYLDRLIKANEAWQASKDFNSRIRAIGGLSSKEIYLNDGVEDFADILRTELKVDRFLRSSGNIGVCKEFEYKGYRVFQIKEEPAGGANADNRI